VTTGAENGHDLQAVQDDDRRSWAILVRRFSVPTVEITER
jgi:hypothetical protein